MTSKPRKIQLMPHHQPWEAVQNVRKNEQEQRMLVAKTANQLLTDAILHRDNLASTRAEIIKELQTRTRGESLNVDQVLHLQRSAEQLATALNLAEQGVSTAESRAQTAQSELLQANQSLRVIQLLLERRASEYEIIEQKLLQREIDDLVTSRFRRQS